MVIGTCAFASGRHLARGDCWIKIRIFVSIVVWSSTMYIAGQLAELRLHAANVSAHTGPFFEAGQLNNQLPPELPKFEIPSHQGADFGSTDVSSRASFPWLTL